MECLKKYPLISNLAEMNIELTTGVLVDAEENISYTTYGLRVLDEDGATIYEWNDVNTKMEFVEGFIRLCVENDVRVVHIPDLLEDYLDCL